jgi:hypothetical protein
MQQIFSYALKVNIWLGYGSLQMSGALTFLRGLTQQPQDGDGRGDDVFESALIPETASYRNLASLARAAWWDRLWV